MKEPIKPENIVNVDLNYYLPMVVEKLNALISNNCRYAENGPYCTLDIADIISEKLVVDRPLTNLVLENVKAIYKKAGWDMWVDEQPNKNRYLVFASNIWKKEK